MQVCRGEDVAYDLRVARTGIPILTSCKALYYTLGLRESSVGHSESCSLCVVQLFACAPTT